MNITAKSRIAPTPSGHLHIGNAYNFLVTYKEIVVKRQGVLVLRIDDCDSTRMRDEYLEDIFTSLEWLEISFDYGPKNPKDFKENFSQGLKTQRYFEVLEKIDGTYVCECGRKFLKEHQCPCKDKMLDFKPGSNAIKFEVKDLELKKTMGDFVLWRKDNLPAYQLVSLVDDIDMGINFIVRGEDLLSSTKAQLLIAKKLNVEVFSNIHFIHHPLIKVDDKKLSKSQGDNQYSIKYWRESGKTKDDLIDYFDNTF